MIQYWTLWTAQTGHNTRYILWRVTRPVSEFCWPVFALRPSSFIAYYTALWLLISSRSKIAMKSTESHFVIIERVFSERRHDGPQAKLRPIDIFLRSRSFHSITLPHLLISVTQLRALFQPTCFHSDQAGWVIIPDFQLSNGRERLQTYWWD